MYKQNFSSRLLCVLTALIISSVALFAQTPTVKHVVERGETLEDIAKHYNVTKEDIISLNPSAEQFVYVGLELTIPQKQVAQQTSVNAVPTTQTSMPGDDYAMNDSAGSGASAGMADDKSFSYWGIGYFANFETADKGFYGLFCRSIADYHFGMDFGAYANYGIVDSDYAGLEFLLGPAIGNKFDNVLASVALDAVIASFGSVDEEGKKDSKIAWGICLLPQLAIDLGGSAKIVLGVGASWSKGADKLGWSFQAGLAF